MTKCNNYSKSKDGHFCAWLGAYIELKDCLSCLRYVPGQQKQETKEDGDKTTKD